MTSDASASTSESLTSLFCASNSWCGIHSVISRSVAIGRTYIGYVSLTAVDALNEPPAAPSEARTIFKPSGTVRGVQNSRAEQPGQRQRVIARDYLAQT